MLPDSGSATVYFLYSQVIWSHKTTFVICSFKFLIMAATYSKNFMFSLALLRFITEQAIAQNDTFEVDSNQTISGSSPSPGTP